MNCVKEKVEGCLHKNIPEYAALRNKPLNLWFTIRQTFRTWNTRYRHPRAARAYRQSERLWEAQAACIENGPATDDILENIGLEIATTMLDAVFDAWTIRSISQFAWRMGLYEATDVLSSAKFTFGLDSNRVMSLMNDGVSALCVSYKHVEWANQGHPRNKDKERVTRAITRVARRLSQKHLLFWCDVIGRSPRDGEWAQQGIDPYLTMPTLRIVSADLQEDIDDSFWMTVEKTAAILRGGFMTYNDDCGDLLLKGNDVTEMVLPTLDIPFSSVKLWLAKCVANPIMFYKNARCPEDKIKVLKYAYHSALSTNMTLRRLSLDVDGLVQLGSTSDFLAFIDDCHANPEHEPFLQISRPTDEILCDGEHGWCGLEDFIPAIKIVEPGAREIMNDQARHGSFKIREIRADEGPLSSVLCTPYKNLLWCSTLRLRVRNFQMSDNEMRGEVLSFRVASREEEESMINVPSLSGLFQLS